MDWVTLVSNMGFPIVATIYLATRLEKKMAENTKTMKDLIIYLKTERKE